MFTQCSIAECVVCGSMLSYQLASLDLLPILAQSIKTEFRCSKYFNSQYYCCWLSCYCIVDSDFTSDGGYIIFIFIATHQQNNCNDLISS